MKESQATGIPDTAEAPAPSPESDSPSGVVVGRPEGVLPIGARDPRDELPEHLGALRAFAISLTRNVAAADDLVQDTIVKAWTNLDRFQPGSTCAPGSSPSCATPSTPTSARRAARSPTPRGSTPPRSARSRPTTGASPSPTFAAPSTASRPSTARC